ncbi:MAG: Mrp/NBP35 family ATP-binding protein [Candidatus Neomarinimicrobiota bacterium]
MDKEKVLEKLKLINYPGFNRDIVSFGMVKDIKIDSSDIIINLNITSQNEEKKEQVVRSIRKELDKYFKNIKIIVDNNSPQGNSPEQTSIQAPILENVKHVIAIASGKGGVGKSTVAANLACSIFKKGYKVGLLDLDIYGPSLPIILGINEQPKMTQDNKLIPLDKFGLKVMSFGFISGNETPVIWRGPLVARMTEQFFRDVEWGNLDILILDLPPGTGDIQLTLTQKLKITGAVMITTPQDMALADVRKGADMFKKVNTPVLGVIENMSGLLLEGKTEPGNRSLEINGKQVIVTPDGSFNHRIELFKMGGGEKESKRLGVPLIGQIPISEEIMQATDRGKPLVMEEEMNQISLIYADITKTLLSII